MSVMPAGGGYRPLRCRTSGRFTPAAATRISTSPAAGSGTARSTACSTWGGPGSRISTAVMVRAITVRGMLRGAAPGVKSAAGGPLMQSAEPSCLAPGPRGDHSDAGTSPVTARAPPASCSPSARATGAGASDRATRPGRANLRTGSARAAAGPPPASTAPPDPETGSGRASSTDSSPPGSRAPWRRSPAPRSPLLSLPNELDLSQSFSSCQQPIVPGRPQPLLQVQHRVALAREQRVDTHPRACRQFPEGQTVELVRHEHLALLGRQLLERRLDLLEQQLANEGGLRSAIRGGQQFVERFVGLLALRRAPVRALLRLVAAKPVDDAMARHPREPRARPLHGLHHAVGQHQLVQRLLQDILGLSRIGNPPADESQQAPALALHRGGDLAVLRGGGQTVGERGTHLPV